MRSRFSRSWMWGSCAGLVCVLLGGFAPGSSPEPKYKGWQMTFSDEFEGTTLDSSKWTLNLPWAGTDGTYRHHNDHYASYMLDKSVVVKDGALHLLTTKEDVTDAKGNVHHYTQGMIHTAKTFRQKYGYFEVRVKLPVESGPGLWPAFWTLAEGWPPEMDICEVWTANNRSHQGMAYRKPGDRRESWDDSNTYTPLPVGWNTYGMEWGPGYQIYTLNGKVTHRVYGPHTITDPHYLLLNSGVSNPHPPTPATMFPNSFDVDYVRIYARPDVPAAHNLDFEDEEFKPWSRWNNAQIVNYNAAGGQRALRVDGAPGKPASAEQTVYNLKPDTTYELTAEIRSDVPARLGVKDQGNEESYIEATSTHYSRFRLIFKTGPEATTARIYCHVPGESGTAYFDNLAINAK